MKKGYEILNTAGIASIRLIKGFSWWENNSQDFTQQIDELIEAGITDAEVYINSPGGDMFHANEITNQLKRFDTVKVKLGALVASAATYVAASFDDVEGQPNTMFMIHDPIFSPVIEHVADFDSQKDLYVGLRDGAIDVYENKTSKERKDISKKMELTTWMNSKKAKAYGFIDRISGTPIEDSVPEDTLQVLNKLGVKVPQVLNTAIAKNKSLDKSKIEMKELAKLLGLPENATEEQLIAAHKIALQQATEAGVTAGADDEAKMEMLLAMAERKGFDKKIIENTAKESFGVVYNMVKAAPEKTGKAQEQSNIDNEARVSEVLKGLIQNSGDGKDRKPGEKKFSELSAVERAELMDKNPDKFNELYNAEFSHVKNGQ